MYNGSCLRVPVKVTLIGWERATAEGGLVHLEDFIYFFIPWQIVMCPKTNRIYNPYEVKSVRRMDVDNCVKKYPFFYRDGGYYIVLAEDMIFTEDIYIVE